MNKLVKNEPDKICLGNQACRPTNCLYPVSKIMSWFKQDNDLIYSSNSSGPWMVSARIRPNLAWSDNVFQERMCSLHILPREDCLRNGFSDISAYIQKWAAFGLIDKSCRPISIILIHPFKLQVNKFVQPVIRFLVGPLPLSTFKATECKYVTNSTELLPWGKV